MGLHGRIIIGRNGRGGIAGFRFRPTPARLVSGREPSGDFIHGMTGGAVVVWHGAKFLYG
ncbi:hypothetical protein DSCW_10850 [Desulfosarcina widdelii]|uniref:Uncharacterized protein n=1 Tax=Desulfosarcina widdelii TaxID=947919 RepID=A0A5K7YYG9_9BACT|nr:hypothetical protein DSCW_10850 [Desulfosarcina widdelii]